MAYAANRDNHALKWVGMGRLNLYVFAAMPYVDMARAGQSMEIVTPC